MNHVSVPVHFPVDLPPTEMELALHQGYLFFKKISIFKYFRCINFQGPLQAPDRLFARFSCGVFL